MATAIRMARTLWISHICFEYWVKCRNLNADEWPDTPGSKCKPLLDAFDAASEYIVYLEEKIQRHERRRERRRQDKHGSGNKKDGKDDDWTDWNSSWDGRWSDWNSSWDDKDDD